MCWGAGASSPCSKSAPQAPCRRSLSACPPFLPLHSEILWQYRKGYTCATMNFLFSARRDEKPSTGYGDLKNILLGPKLGGAYVAFLQYLSLHFASTLAVLANLTVHCGSPGMHMHASLRATRDLLVKVCAEGLPICPPSSADGDQIQGS